MKQAPEDTHACACLPVEIVLRLRWPGLVQPYSFMCQMKGSLEHAHACGGLWWEIQRLLFARRAPRERDAAVQPLHDCVERIVVRAHGIVGAWVLTQDAAIVQLHACVGEKCEDATHRHVCVLIQDAIIVCGYRHVWGRMCGLVLCLVLLSSRVIQLVLFGWFIGLGLHALSHRVCNMHVPCPMEPY